MKFVRYIYDGEINYGIVEGDRIKQITGKPYEEYEVTDNTQSLSDVKLLAPVVPGKIIAIGLNYTSHLDGLEPPSVPEPFFKTPSSVIGDGDTVVIPADAIRDNVVIQPEAELSLVIGKKCRNISKSESLKYVLGYTCGNDVSARDWQANDMQWWRAKSSDTFAPLGPFIVTNLDPGNLRLIGRINGKIVQESSTADLIHDVPTIIEFVSKVITLEPGDVIMTGTPGKAEDVHSGDTVNVEIEGIGILSNPVSSE